MNDASFFKKILTCLTLGLVLSALLLLLGNSGTIAWFPPVVVFSLVGISLLAALIYPFLWQYQQVRGKVNSPKIYAWLYALIRYCIAFNLACFGWKKLFGLQFVVPLSVAEKPMNQQSGEWLTWYYFGHSFAYGLIVAAIQIGGSLMLMFRKTLLLGVIILFAFMLNLTLINIFYQMNAGALLQSVVITLGLLFLIMCDYKRLVEFFFRHQPNLFSGISIHAITKNLIKFSAIILSLLFTIYLKSLVK
ncbi:MAG: hypothetical protein EOP45_08750 [Sphingobacteriaceae bacterium]|nr:MAG: hypothetical protein EOP45_08750 [Sphingobacteriaceae bacterium]